MHFHAFVVKKKSDCSYLYIVCSSCDMLNLWNSEIQLINQRMNKCGEIRMGTNSSHVKILLSIVWFHFLSFESIMIPYTCNVFMSRLLEFDFSSIYITNKQLANLRSTPIVGGLKFGAAPVGVIISYNLTIDT